MNCDADFLFNKDPKDPNKYEIEGAKGVQAPNLLMDYYLKMIQDHPLLAYLEDAFAEVDIESSRQFKRTLARKYPQVQMGIFFKSVENLQNMTSWEPLDEDESTQWQQKVEIARGEDEKTNSMFLDDVPQVVGHKNASKFTPHVAQLRTGNLATVTEMVQIY